MKNKHSHAARGLLAGSAVVPLLLATSPEGQAQTIDHFILGGYAETFFQWNANDPSNAITNYRGFDNRHNSFTLSNLALDALWDEENLMGRVTVQVGNTPSTYYLAEPALAGSGSANATGPELWKYVQQALVGYRSQGGHAWTANAGLCLSPVGPEGIAVRDNWNWSRSNLFFGLPFYHTGVRVMYPFDDERTASFAVFNGWNSVVDNNDEKSVCAQFMFARPSKLTASVLYFGGVERPAGAPEGRPWRHLFDVFASWDVTERLSLLVQADTGFESTRFGTSRWAAGAAYARIRATESVYLAARVDVFDETVASNEAGTASAIFWPVSWVSSGTFTIDYRPVERASFRVEYRHDAAEGDMYFGGDVDGDGVATPFAPNRSRQDTITVGAVTWF
jgi:hypothetical protein